MKNSLFLAWSWLEFPVPAYKTTKRKFSEDTRVIIAFINIYSMRKIYFTGLVTHFSQRPDVPALHNELTRKLQPGGIFYSLFRSVIVGKIPFKDLVHRVYCRHLDFKYADLPIKMITSVYVQ